MFNDNTFETPEEKARRAKKGLTFYSEELLCDCNKCYGVEKVPRPAATVYSHRRNNGTHPDALRTQGGPIGRDNLMDDLGGPSTSISSYPDDAFSNYHHSNLEFRPQFDSGSYAQSRPLSRSSVNPHLESQSTFDSAFIPESHLHSRSASQCSAVSDSDLIDSRLSHSPRAVPRTCSFNDNDSDSDDPDRSPDDFVPNITDPNQDVEIFGSGLARFRVASPPPLRLRGSWPDDEDEDDQRDGDDDGDGDRGGDEVEPEGPEDPDGGAEPEDEDGPPIHINPEGEPGPPGVPEDGGAQGMPALDEHPILRNIYLRTWVQYAFAGVTQDSIQDMLESHKSALLALLEIRADAFPADFAIQVHKMPTTLRSLERRLGLDFSDLISILYTETTLATQKQKRTPAKSFPSTSLLQALGRLLSRPGIADFMQHWRRDGDEPVEVDVPPPVDPDVWFGQMGPEDKFGDMTQGWGWRNQEVGLRRRWDNIREEYIDEPTEGAPLSLVHLPYGLSLGLNTDGYQAHRGKFTAGGSYSVTGVYIVVNNLPFYLRHTIENMILVMVLPGPKEPKGYALAQMLEPLVNDLIALMNGVDLPVYNSNTGEIEQRRVYAQLSALLMDWIARIKCIGHVGVTAEHNHCPYCKIRQCYLGEARGYQPHGYNMRDLHEHLQDKHRWLRALEPDREAIRQQTGTTFTVFDQIPGFYSFDICPPDPMHLFDLGVTPAIIKLVYQLGMLRKRYRGQPVDETPEARFNAFLDRCYFPHFCGRLPTELAKMGGHTKAEQWNTLLVVLIAALFEAWKVGDTIPENDIPRGGRNTVHFKNQMSNARRLLRRRRHVHNIDGGELDDAPELEECFPSRNPRDYFANIMRYRVAHAVVTQHQISREEIDTFTPLFELVGITFAEMNLNLPPIFHAATHLRPFLLKYGNVYGTRVAAFERANRMLINVNTNGHGKGVLEATMAKAFMRRTECYRYVKIMQSIEQPSDDDTKTLDTLLKAMKDGPEHEVQRGMLDAVLAGQAPFRGQEHIRLATTSAKVNFHERAHSPYYRLMINFCNEYYPFNNARFYGPGVRPPNGVYISPATSTVSYSHFYRYGVRYGSAHHSRGYKSRFGFIYDREPVLIKGVYATTVAVGNREFRFIGVMVRRFIAPAQRPIFPWDHWNDLLEINAWEYRQFSPVLAVPLSAFTGVFAMSDIEMSYGRYALTFAMIKTRPEDLVEGYINHNHENNGERDEDDDDDDDELDGMDQD